MAVSGPCHLNSHRRCWCAVIVKRRQRLYSIRPQLRLLLLHQEPLEVLRQATWQVMPPLLVVLCYFPNGVLKTGTLQIPSPAKLTPTRCLYVPTWVPAVPPTQFQSCRFSLSLWGALSAVRTQCGHSATIWASSRTGDPYFVILGHHCCP